MTRRLPTLLLALALAGGLSACVSLLPKSEPAQLYRFGQPAEPATEQTPGAVGVFRANASFQQEAASDHILTITAGKAAYIAESRWVAPASILWDQAVVAAFEVDPGPVRLVSRGEAAVADYVMRLDVRNFEARYIDGPKAPPTVVVRVRAALTRGTDRSLASERLFEQRVTAADNRVGAIVAAYDQAVQAVLVEVVAWANEQAKPPA